jgi:hypothetical protein
LRLWCASPGDIATLVAAKTEPCEDAGVRIE